MLVTLDLPEVYSNLRELQFRLNGLFDPDFSLGGHQPMGFDEWSAFYGRYRVKSAKCKIRAVSNTTVNVPMAVIAYLLIRQQQLGTYLLH